MRPGLLLAVALTSAACDSPTAPRPTGGIPQVAGTYTGPLTMTVRRIDYPYAQHAQRCSERWPRPA